MTTRKKALTGKLLALNTLLDAPRPEDADWSHELLVALESIYELALRPEVQPSAKSREHLTVAA